MESSCVRHNLIPGTTKLFSDYLYDFGRVNQFYPFHFTDAEALSRSAKAVNYPESRRERIVTALRRQNGDSAALSDLARAGTVAGRRTPPTQ